MRLKKIVTLALVTAVAATMTADCGSSSSDKGSVAPEGTAAGSETAGGEADSEETEKRAASGEEQELTVSVWDNNTTPQFTSVTKAFTEEYPDVEMKYIDAPSDKYANKVTVMLASDDADSDMIFIKDTENQVTMKGKGQILDLDGYTAKDRIDLTMYNGVADQLKVDGSNYVLPFHKDWYMLYLNRDLSDKAGVPYPSADMTWDKYEELAKKVTSGKDSAKVYGIHNHTWQALVSNWAVRDGKNTLMSEDYSLLEPYYEQALRIQDEDVVRSYANLETGNTHYINVLEQQQCVMIPMGSWFIGTLTQDKDAGKFDFNWDVTAIPHLADTKAGTTIGSTTPAAINAKSDVPDLAWEYMKLVADEESAQILADNGIFPATESQAVSDKLAAILGSPEDGQDALKTTSWVLDRPLDAKMATVRKVPEGRHSLIMIGEEDVDTDITNMNQRAQKARED